MQGLATCGNAVADRTGPAHPVGPRQRGRCGSGRGGPRTAAARTDGRRRGAGRLLNNQGLQATYEDLGSPRPKLVEAGLLRNPTLGASFRFPRYRAFPYDLDVTQSFLDLLTDAAAQAGGGGGVRGGQAAGDDRGGEHRRRRQGRRSTGRRGRRSWPSCGGTSSRPPTPRYDAAQRLHDAGNITRPGAGQRAGTARAGQDRSGQGRAGRAGRAGGVERHDGRLGDRHRRGRSPRGCRTLPAAEVDPADLESLALVAAGRPGRRAAERPPSRPGTWD